MSRLRGGSAGAARGASSFRTETVSRVRNAGGTGQLTVRADSAFYSKKMLATAAKFGVRFSVTARQDKRIRAAIDAIPDSAWQPIPVLVVHAGGLGRRHRRDTVHRLRRRQAPRPAGPPVRAPGPSDPRLAAGAVHRLGLPRVRHRPHPAAAGGGGRPRRRAGRRRRRCCPRQRRCSPRVAPASAGSRPARPGRSAAPAPPPAAALRSAPDSSHRSSPTPGSAHGLLATVRCPLCLVRSVRRKTDRPCSEGICMSTARR